MAIKTDLSALVNGLAEEAPAPQETPKPDSTKELKHQTTKSLKRQKAKTPPEAVQPTSFSLPVSTIERLDVAVAKLRTRTKGKLQRGQVNKTAIANAALKMAMDDLEGFAKRLIDDLEG